MFCNTRKVISVLRRFVEIQTPGFAIFFIFRRNILATQEDSNNKVVVSFETNF